MAATHEDGTNAYRQSERYHTAIALLHLSLTPMLAPNPALPRSPAPACPSSALPAW